MHLTLEVKRYHEFFWLRDIQAVNIYKCCAECFIGNRDSRVYHGTLHQPHALIDIDVKENPKAVAYYLCGLSAGFVDNANIRLTITDAKRVDFQSYVPNPPAEDLPQLDLCELHQRRNAEEVKRKWT